MSGRDEKGGRRPKKPYARPEVKQVQLRPEEAVLGNCKSSGTAGPSGGDCGACPVTGCSSCGS
jgi:hypothetical protein